MIDPITFSAQWAVLEDRFQTRHNAETAAQYLDALEEELMTEQFLVACKRAFRFETFFPSPQCLIDHALGDFLSQAEDAWDHLMERLVGGLDVLTEPGSIERQILARVGGGKMLAEASDYGRRDMREQFRRRYARALREKATPDVPVVKALKAPPVEPPPVLEAPRGKTVDFLQMARSAGCPVPIDSAAHFPEAADD